jgi:tRNA threonylcarbamoyladenosine biosynthesis protein TsaE
VSDLGGGKTTLTRGLAKGFGSSDKVASPSFTLSKIYKAKGKELHHFDFYRLQEPGALSNELAEVLEDNNNVVVVEWPGIVQDVLPKDRMTIHLRVTSPDSREIEFCYPEQLTYLLKGVNT